jgi:hypothetical protein
LDDFAAVRDEGLLAKPNETAAARNTRSNEAECAALYKRSFFALRRGTDLATATGDSPAQAGAENSPLTRGVAVVMLGKESLPRHDLISL